MSNENETLYSSTKVYEYLYGNITLCVTYYFGLALVFILGPLLSLPIVFYERFGADRQKRTIINRLLSLIFINITMQSCIWSGFRLVRGTVGLLEDDSILPIIMFSQVLSISSLFFSTEVTILRFLYIVVWRRMKTINDDFWNVVLMISTYAFSVFYSTSVCLVGGHNYNAEKIINITFPKDSRYNCSFNALQIKYKNYKILLRSKCCIDFIFSDRR